MSKLSTQHSALSTATNRVLETLFGRYIAAERLRGLLALHRAWVLVGLLTVAGLVLRRYHLGVESFWFDEADIVAQAQAPALHILTDFTKAGANGPLYTLLLHFWIGLLGTSETAVRTLPMIFGTATIPLMYLVGRRLLTPTIGLFGALLLTVSPFHIWHSQDAKMYTLVVFVILLSLGLYLVALERDRPAWWVAYLLVTWVALYAHILAALFLVAQLLVTPLLLRRIRPAEPPADLAAVRARRNRLLLAWGLLLLPFLPIALDRILALIAGNIVAGWLTPISLGDMLGVLFVRFAVNRADPPWEAVGMVVMLGLAILDFGFWILDLSRRRRQGLRAEDYSRVALLILWAVPIALFWVATLRVPLFEPRYMIIVLPFYLFFVAGGLARLAILDCGLGILDLRRRRQAASNPAALLTSTDTNPKSKIQNPKLLLVGLVALGVPTLAALLGVNYGPYGQKEDWRGAMDFIRQHERLRDVVIVYPGYLVTAVDYYRTSGDLPTVPVRTIPQLDTRHFGEREFNDALLATITDRERAWLVLSPPRTAKEDPDSRVLHWFQYNWHQFEKRVYNGVEVYGFAFNGQPRSWFPEPDHPQHVLYANGLLFRGYIYELRNNATQAQNASWLPLTLYWETAQPLPAEYSFRIEILDAQGQVKVRDGPLPPLQGYWPTTRWPAPSPIIDYRDVFLPGDLPPGAYRIRLTVVPNDHPDQPLLLADGGPSFVFDTPLTVVAWHNEAMSNER